MSLELLVPSKTFIFGEYAALVGGPALLVTDQPYFKCRLTQKSLSNVKSFKPSFLHPLSPGGRFLQELARKKNELWDLSEIKCNYSLGGLGQSSAEFVSVYKCNIHTSTQKLNDEQIWQALKDYKNLFKTGTVPSGYDVVAQFKEGFVTIFDSEKKLSSEASWPFKDLDFVICGTRTKLKTHEHLASNQIASYSLVMLELSKACYSNWVSKNVIQWVEAMKDFRHGLQSLGLEAPFSTKAIEDFEKESGFVFGKGCGAMGADFVIIFFESSKREFFVNKAKNHKDLVYVTDSLQIGY